LINDSKESPMRRLDGRIAIVTGAAQGIGATYAKALAAEGASVCVADLADPSGVVAAIIEAGGKAIAVTNDVTDPASCDDMVSKTIEAFGRIDILINNAALFGKLALKKFDQIATTEWDAMMAVNVRGTFECAKAVLPAMQRQKYGKIINVASGTVFKGTPMMLHYVTSKGAVVALTRCLAREVGDDGIRVNCIAPGLVMSDNVRANPAWAAQLVAANVATRAIKRDAEPEDLIGALLFLSSADSDFMTGQTIVVDGGSVMH
jgi:NAD(P)-dependent dehydrogenase (short-subunit alcohol dehydrogenase family)